MGEEGWEGWCGLDRGIVGKQGAYILVFRKPVLTRVSQQYTTALGLLEDSYPSPAVDAQLTRDQLHALIVRFLIHLCLGTTHHAEALFPLFKASDISQEQKNVLQGLLWTCQGRVEGVMSRAGEKKDNQGTLDLVIANNEAVAMLETGALTQVSNLDYATN